MTSPPVLPLAMLLKFARAASLLWVGVLVACGGSVPSGGAANIDTADAGFDARGDAEQDAAQRDTAALEDGAGGDTTEDAPDPTDTLEDALEVDAVADTGDAATEGDATPDACVPVDEVCNGVDDDCDGEIDEDLTQACATLCDTPGEQVCASGVWQACIALEHTDEVCNGVDDDCDGLTDEDLTRACGTDVGACELGTERCVDGSWVGCDDVGPRPERCNGQDMDCNGAVDDIADLAPAKVSWPSEDILRVVWAGDRLAAFKARRDTAQEVVALTLQWLSPEGLPMGEPKVIREDDTSEWSLSDVVWTGDGFGVVWWQRTTLYAYSRAYLFRRLDAEGTPIGPTRLLTQGIDYSVGGALSLAWSGYGFGMAYGGGEAVVFALLDIDGRFTREPQILLTSLDRSNTVRLYWDGGAYTLVASDAIATVSSTGELLHAWNVNVDRTAAAAAAFKPGRALVSSTKRDFGQEGNPWLSNVTTHDTVSGVIVSESSVLASNQVQDQFPEKTLMTATPWGFARVVQYEDNDDNHTFFYTAFNDDGELIAGPNEIAAYEDTNSLFSRDLAYGRELHLLIKHRGSDLVSGEFSFCPPALACDPDATEVCDGIDNDCDGQIDEGLEALAEDCDTGLPGRCAQGRSSCQNGRLLCVMTAEPEEEVCDGVDNNCNGVIDDLTLDTLWPGGELLVLTASSRNYLELHPNTLVHGDNGATHWGVWVEGEWHGGDQRIRLRQPGVPTGMTDLAVSSPDFGIAYTLDTLHVFHVDPEGRLAVARWNADSQWTPDTNTLGVASDLSSLTMTHLNAHLGLVWRQGDAVMARVIDAAGEPISEPLELSAQSDSAPTIHADDSAFVITWLEDGGLRMVRLSNAGVPQSTPETPALVGVVEYDTAPTQDGLAVAWVDPTQTLWLAHLDRSGQELHPPLLVSSNPVLFGAPSVSPAGADVVLAWMESTRRTSRGEFHVRAARVRPGADTLPPTVQLQLHHSATLYPSIVALDGDTVEVLATTSGLVETRRFELGCP